MTNKSKNKINQISKITFGENETNADDTKRSIKDNKIYIG